MNVTRPCSRLSGVTQRSERASKEGGALTETNVSTGMRLGDSFRSQKASVSVPSSRPIMSEASNNASMLSRTKWSNPGVL